MKNKKIPDCKGRGFIFDLITEQDILQGKVRIL